LKHACRPFWLCPRYMLDSVFCHATMPQRKSDLESHLASTIAKNHIPSTISSSEQCKSTFFSWTKWNCFSRIYPPNSRYRTH
jgi:hypothetical protein